MPMPACTHRHFTATCWKGDNLDENVHSARHAGKKKGIPSHGV